MEKKSKKNLPHTSQPSAQTACKGNKHLICITMSSWF